MAADPSNPLSFAGPLVAGAGLAYVLGKGESPLPGDIQNVQNVYAPTQFGQGQQLYGEGQQLIGQGTADLSRAVSGKLTPEQQAQLTQLRSKETNQALQMYEGMGRTPGKDTSFLSTEQSIDTNLLAASQSFVDTNIKTAFGELSAGGSFVTMGASFETAAANELMAAGQDQMKLDEDYSNAIAAAFGSIAKSFGGGGGTTVKVG